MAIISIKSAEQNRTWVTRTSVPVRFTGMDEQYINGVWREGSEGSKLVDGCGELLAEEEELSRLLHRTRPLYYAPEVLRTRVSSILSSEITGFDAPECCCHPRRNR
jgi:hypothetical protein